MKQFLFGAALLLLSTMAHATLNITSGKKYRIACNKYPSGCISIASTGVKSSTGITFFKANYAQAFSETPANYWVLTEVKPGFYSIKNASKNTYITYNGVKSMRYLGALSTTLRGDSSLWSINPTDAGFAIMNKANSIHRFDVSSKDSTINYIKTKVYTLGTYTEGLYDQNIFNLYDENDKLVSTAQKKVATVSDYIDTLFVGGKPAVCDTAANTYLQAVSTTYREGKSYAAPVKFRLKNAAYSLQIDGKTIKSGDSYTFSSVEGTASYKVSILSGTTTLVTTPLSFTFLPIVELTTPSIENYGDTYVKGAVRVIDPESSLYDSLYSMKIKYRGGSARDYLKKPYAVKLIDAKGNSIDRNILGLREDNSWILDAMAVDQLRCRNRASTDLWLDFSKAPYFKSLEPKMRCGTHGKFVDVFRNGVYSGVFCMTDKIDRSLLKLKKYKDKVSTASDTIRGVLYKASYWSYSVWMGYDSYSKSYTGNSPSDYDNTAEEWDGWECQYPDLGDGQSIDWGPLYDVVNLVASGSDTQFKAQLPKLLDLPVMRDYYLYIELMFAQDNNGKNTFMFSYDKQKYPMLSLCPWDMDGTWGQQWDGSHNDFDPSTDFATWMKANQNIHTLYKRLMELNFQKWNDSLSIRYAQLRNSAWTVDNIMKYFTTYTDLLTESGAYTREMKAWSGRDFTFDFPSELTYVRSYITKRLAALDKAYKYVATDIKEVTNNNATEPYIAVRGGQGTISIHANDAALLPIYSVTGRLIRTVSVQSGLTEVDNIPAGIYIVAKQKVLVK